MGDPSVIPSLGRYLTVGARLRAMGLRQFPSRASALLQSCDLRRVFCRPDGIPLESGDVIYCNEPCRWPTSYRQRYAWGPRPGARNCCKRDGTCGERWRPHSVLGRGHGGTPGSWIEGWPTHQLGWGLRDTHQTSESYWLYRRRWEYTMPMMKTGIARQISAFVVTPLVTPVLMVIVSLAGKPAEGIWVALFALPFTIGTTILPGVPLYFLFRARPERP
ncbi:MAG: hypothetical protein GAK28_03497 [Luteibacter sp.]|nr:MAG: hypothetical protein GAK28_03497 [Luteibacter sp.]